MNLNNRSDLKKIYSGYQGAGRSIYVPTEYFETFNKILREYRTNYHMTSIMRQIVSLNANPLQGSRINPGGDLYQCTQGNISMQYCIYQGAVVINYLQINAVKPDERFGLYSVKYEKNDKRWVSVEKPIRSLNKKDQWKSKSTKANYVAVAGRFDNRQNAGNLISTHIINAYHKANFLTSSDATTPFSMFWIKRGQHKSPDAAEALASIMQQSSQSNLPVNWLIHDAGADTFKAAARILSQKPLADAQQRAQDNKAGFVQAQNVYFSNPNTSSIKSLEKLCQQAGLNYVGSNSNNRDLRRFSTLKNVAMELGKPVLMTAGAGGSVSAVSQGLGHIGVGSAQKVIDNGLNALLNGNYLATAAAMVATGFIAVGVYKRGKTIGAALYCTFGNGNQKWYTSDSALIG